jgi:hypothetical protein
VCWARKVPESSLVMVEVVFLWVLRRIRNNRLTEETTFEHTSRSYWMPHYYRDRALSCFWERSFTLSGTITSV